MAALRHHWLAAALLSAGLILRVLAQLAYRPALFYIDTTRYLYNVAPGMDPLGYKGVLRGILAVASLGTVAAIQRDDQIVMNRRDRARSYDQTTIG